MLNSSFIVKGLKIADNGFKDKSRQTKGLQKVGDKEKLNEGVLSLPSHSSYRCNYCTFKYYTYK